MWKEVEKFLAKEQPTILHTGELCDSLAAPGSEKIMSHLIRMFGQQDKHTLLLLTKSDRVEPLLHLKHNARTVIGFSINPEPIAERFELGAPSMEERLEAAERCIEVGYPVMVRVDPMIPVDGWEQLYANLFDRLNELDLKGVVVGTLRAYPGLIWRISRELRSMLTERGGDRRYHLPLNLRFSMYKLAFSTLRYEYMGVCKESSSLWVTLTRAFKKKFLCNCTCNKIAGNATQNKL
jgi:spore photoproduct lyase